MSQSNNLPIESNLIVGWREWRLEGTLTEPRLQSITMEDIWPVRKPIQVFDSNWRIDSGINGIHAYKTFRDLASDLGLLSFRVVGEVWMWGRMVEHQFGWRSEFAYPKRLLVAPEKHDPIKLMALEEAYGVPVEESDKFPDFVKADDSSFQKSLQAYVNHISQNYTLYPSQVK